MKEDDNLRAWQLVALKTRFRRVANTIAGLFVLFVIGLAFLPWQQTAKGYGKVIALSPNEREQTIHASVSGRLGQWYVHDGSYVKKGDPIVELVDIDPELIKRLRMEKQAVELRLEAATTAAKTSLINVKRQKQLFEEGISARRQYEQARFEYIKYQNQIAKAQIDLAKIKVRISRQESQLVKAPLSGTILRRLAGQESVLVKQGQVLCLLVPDTTSRAVALWMDGNDIPLIKVNQHVRLQFEGWPAVQFSGWPMVAIGTFGGTVYLVDPTDNGKNQFRILVVPDKQDAWPSSRFLRQNVQAHGWVLLNQVSLWFELWRRFNGFPPTADPEADLD